MGARTQEGSKESEEEDEEEEEDEDDEEEGGAFLAHSPPSRCVQGYLAHNNPPTTVGPYSSPIRGDLW